MFEDNYKKAFDNIKPNDSVKESILEKIEAAEGKQEKKNPERAMKCPPKV